MNTSRQNRQRPAAPAPRTGHSLRRLLTLSCGIGALLGSLASAQSGLNTAAATVTPLDLTRLLRAAPAFGASLPQGLRLLQGDEAARFAALGTPTWVTAASLQAASTARIARLNANVAALRSVAASASRPELATLLRLAQTDPFTEPLVTVQTASGPIQVRLQSAEVGLEVAVSSLRASGAGSGVRASNRALALSYARRLGLDEAGIRAVQDAGQAEAAPPGGQGTAPGGDPVGRAGGLAVQRALGLVARQTLRINPALLPPEGQGDGLDTQTPGGPCQASATGIVSALEFPLKASLPPVRNQGARGTCWAFATVGAVETTLRQDERRNVNLSEQDFVAYTKLIHDQLSAGEGFWPFRAVTEASQNNYRFALEADWQYNQSLQRSASQPDKSKDQWVYKNSCQNYPDGVHCADNTPQAPSACLISEGKTSCGYQTVARRSRYGVFATDKSNIWEPENRAYSLFLTALAVRSGSPVIMVHDSRYLNGGRFVPDLPYSAVPDCDDAGQHCKPGSAASVRTYLHATLLVGYVTNAELKAKLPGAPEGAGGGYFIMRNSWGSCWGDGGYAYLPWNWMEKYVGELDANVRGTVN